MIYHSPSTIPSFNISEIIITFLNSIFYIDNFKEYVYKNFLRTNMKVYPGPYQVEN